MPDNEPIPAEQDINVPSNYRDYLAEKAFVLNHVPTIPDVKQKLIASATNPSTQFVQNVSDQVKEQFDKVSQPDMLNLSNTIAGFNADKINALTSIQPPETTTQQQSLDEPKMKELDAQDKSEKATEIKNWADVVGETVPTGTIIKIDDRFKSEDAAFLKQLQRLNPAWTGEYLQMQNNSDGSVVPKAYNVAAAFKNNPTSLVQELPGVAVMVDSKPIKDEDAQKWIADQIDKQKEKDTENIATGALEFGIGNYAPSDRLKDANIPIPAAKLLMKNADLFNNFKDELNSAEGGDVVSQKGQANVLARAIAKTYDFDKIPNQEAIDAVQNANGLKATQYAFTKRQDELAAKLKVIGESNIDQNQLAQYQALQAKMLSNPTAITEDDKKNYAMLTMAVNDAVAKSGAQNAQQIWLEYQNNNKQFADILKQTPQLLQGATTPEGANGVNILLKQQKGQYLINTLSNYFPDLKAAEDKQQEVNAKGSDMFSLPKNLYKGFVIGTQSMEKGAANLLGGDKFESDVASGLSNKGDFESNLNFITPVRPTDTKSDLTNFWNGATNFVDKTAGQIGQMLPVIATTIASGGSSAAELTPFMLQGYHDTELQMRREGVPQNYAETAGLINAALTGITMKLGFMPAKILEGKIANIGMKELLDSKFSQQSVMDYLQKFAPTKGDARNAFMGAAQGLSMQIAQHVQNTEANKEFGTKLDTSQLMANNVFNNAVQMAGITYTLGTISRFNDKAAATQLALKYADENPVMFASALDNAKQQALATGRFDINRLNELQNNVSRFYLKQHGMPLNMNGEQQVAAMNVLDKIASLKGQLENVDPEFKSAIETQIKDQQASLHAIAEDPKKAEAHNNTIVKPVMQALQQDGLFKEPAAPVVQGTPEEITKPIELNPENTDAEYKPQIRDDYFADKHFTSEERAAYDKLDEAGKNKMVDAKRKQLAGQEKQPEVTNADFKGLADDKGFTDLKDVAPKLMKDFKTGDKVKFFIDGKERDGEWDAEKGRIVDKDGNGWGLTAILNEKDGYIKKADEVQQPTEVSGTQNAEPIENSEAAGQAENKITEPIKTEDNATVSINPTGKVGAHTGGGESIGGSSESEGMGHNQQGAEPAKESQVKGEEKTISIKGAELANKLRKLKSKPDKLQANIFGIPIAIYDGAIETVATAIEKGSELAEAIQKGIAHIKSKGGKVDEESFAKHIEDFAAGEKPKIKVQVGGEAERNADATNITSLQNEVVDRKREGLGLSPAIQSAKKEFGETWTEAENEIENGRNPEDLVKELLHRPRPLTDVENAILLRHQIAKETEFHEINDRINKASDNEDATALNENKVKRAKVLDDLQDIYNAGKSAGTENARGLVTRKLLTKDDYSLTSMISKKRAANDGAKLTEEQLQQIQQQHADIVEKNAAYEKRLKELEEENSRLAAEKKILETKKANEAVKPKAAAQKKTHTEYVKERKDAVQAARDALRKLRTGESGLSAVPVPFARELAAIAPHVGKIIKSLIEEGVDKLGDVVDAIHEEFKDDIPGLRRRDIHDLIAGDYNEKGTKNKIAEKIGDLRKQSKLIKKLEDLRNGLPKDKDGNPSAEKSAEVKELEAKIKEVEKQLEKVSSFYKKEVSEKTKPEPKTNAERLVDAKKKVNDSIESIKKQIENKERDLVEKKKPLNEDLELTRLKEQQKALQGLLDKYISKEEDIYASEKAKSQYKKRITDDIIDLNEQINKKERNPKPEKKFEDDEEIKKLKAIRDAKQDVLDELLPDDEGKKAALLKAFKTRTKNRIDELNEKIKNQDFSKPIKNSAVLDPEAMKLKSDLEAAKEKYDLELKKDELKKRSTKVKILDTFVKIERAFKLSHLTTLAKLGSAGATRIIQQPLEQVVGAGINAIAPKLSAKAEYEGGGLNVKAEAKAITEGFMKGLRDSADLFKKGGKSELDYNFGKKGHLPSEAIEFFGTLHSAIKAPVKRIAFERSLNRRVKANIKNGVDVSDPMVMTKIAMDAYKDANRAIFMQDNMVSDAYRVFASSLENSRKHPEGGKIAADAFQFLLPFVKVGTNVVGETVNTAFGLPAAGAKLIHAAFTKGIDNMSNDEAEFVIRSLKKGTIGVGALLLGYFNPTNLGGYYQEGEKRKDSDVKSGTARIFGLNIPSWLLHTPLMQTMQLGATIRRLHDIYVNKGDDMAMATALISGTGELVGEEPLLKQPVDLIKLLNPKERDYAMGNLVENTVVPGLVQDIAKMTDSADKRKPQNVLQHVEQGIPGLRQDVPTSNPSKKKGRFAGRILPHRKR